MAYLGRVYRWEVYWVDFEPHVGSEQAGESRPAVVVSNNASNKTLRTVTVVPLTKLEGKERRVYPFEVELGTNPVGNGYTSIALPNQVRTIDKMRLKAKAGEISNAADQYAIEGGLLDHLGIYLEEDEPAAVDE